MNQNVGEFDLARFLRDERIQVEMALDRAINTLRPLVPPVIFEPLEHGIRAGGKRLRPILCVASHSASTPGGSPTHVGCPEIYDLAASIELIHCYSLMHDDLPCMDDAALRRGHPTPHTIYGESATVVAGATLIPAAGLLAWRAAKALALEDEVCRDVVRILSRAAGAEGMVGGQGLDLLGEEKELNREELDRLHQKKTGALLTASLVLGGKAAGAPLAVLEALESFGREIGLAFQIADDVLDATADADTLGKNPSDRDLEKATYVSLLGVDEARSEAWRRVEFALHALAEAGIESEALSGLAVYVVGRDH